MSDIVCEALERSKNAILELSGVSAVWDVIADIDAALAAIDKPAEPTALEKLEALAVADGVWRTLSFKKEAGDFAVVLTDVQGTGPTLVAAITSALEAAGK